MTLVTIILTTLNSERYLARSIESCLSQSHADIELIIVDGGSTDSTLDITARYLDPRMRVLHQRSNKGKLPGALNLGMQAATGEFITWTQDDSWYAPDAIEQMLQYLQHHPETALVYSDYWDVDETGKPIKYQRVHPPSDILVDDVVRQCFLFRRLVYETIGPQDTQYFPVHEIPWRLRVHQRFGIAPLHRPLMFYSVHSQSLTGRIGGFNLQRMMSEALLAEGAIDSHEHRIRLARIDLDAAWDAFVLRGDYVAFRRFAASALWRRPSLCNAGVAKLFLSSLTPWRAGLRERLLKQWQDREDALYQQLRAQSQDMSR